MSTGNATGVDQDLFKILSELRAKGTLLAFDPVTGEPVDVDEAIERDFGLRPGV